MKNKLFLPVFLLIVGTNFLSKHSTAQIQKEEKKVTTTTTIKTGRRNAEEKLSSDMRKLWEDHITWTRNVIFCIIDELPGTDQAVTRLLKNQDDIGNAIKPYYGENAGEKLTNLLHVHITTAADLLKATKADDNTAFNKANTQWAENADEIAKFLSDANPNWKLDDMKMMMDDHLRLTTDETIARKNKNYEDDVKAFEKVHEEILLMSDMLSDGIVKQFPDKFKVDRAIGMEK